MCVLKDVMIYMQCEILRSASEISQKDMLKYYYNHVKDNFINLRQVERHVYL